MNDDLFFLGIKAIVLDSDKRVLLLKASSITRSGYKRQPYWDLPGGRMQKGDTVESALRREVEEETGIANVTTFEPFSMVLSNQRTTSGDDSRGIVLSAYICRVEKVENIRLSDEHTEYKWVSLQEASDLLRVKYPETFISRLTEILK